MFALFRRDPRFIGFGFMVTFGSSAGQTFFISLFIPAMGAALAVSEAGLSYIYGAATVASAFLLPFVGRLIDRMDLVHFGALVGLGLTMACFITAAAFNVAVLVTGIFALRLFGQGLMSHTAITAAARWYGRDRGKALALTSLGHAMGEALLPVLAVALIGWVGWRWSMALSGVVLGLLVVATALFWIRAQIAFRRPFPRKDDEESEAETGGGILASPWFQANLPLYIASPMLVTALIFHQGTIARELGMTLELFAASFVVFAATRVPGSLLGGPLVDRYTARVLMPVQMLPAIAGILLLASAPGSLTVLVYMGLVGFSTGLGATVKQAVIAELVPGERLGTARSMTSSIMVLSTAAGPAAFGLLLSQGVGAVGLLWISAIYFALTSVLSLLANGFLTARPVE